MDYIQQMQRTVSTSQSSNQPLTPSLSSEIQELKEQLLNQKNHFERFQQLSKSKIYSLEKEVSELRAGFLKVKEQLDKINDKEIVRRTREQFNSRQDRAPSDMPIDRNGVAPADVAISKIFNCAGKKF